MIARSATLFAQLAAAATLACGLPATAAAQAIVPAFPGAEGAGRFAQGGRGGRVLRVTNLDDAGPGSLRAAVEARGPRTIVFDVAGTILLTTPLVVRHGRVTVAGQTARGGGITLRDQPLIIRADDVIVRHVRSRLGDASGVEADAISVERGHRVILDHVSASWSVDETLSVGGRSDRAETTVADVTVQNSIIAESLNASGHAKGDHGYGTLARGGFGGRVSFVGNLWASHRARMPRPGNYNGPDVDPVGPLFEFRQNVFFNWGGSHAGYDADTTTVSTYAFVGNAYLPGPNSQGRWAFEDRNPMARAWFEGNAMDGVVPADAWTLVRGDGGPGERLTARPDWAGSADADPAATLERVLNRAGAWPRDAVDARVVAGVRDGSGRIIDSQAQVGGWPEGASAMAWIDADGDGMPDDWERAHGLDPADPSDGARDGDGDGFTNLEDWLNALG